jgi:hypothetical protein
VCRRYLAWLKYFLLGSFATAFFLYISDIPLRMLNLRFPVAVIVSNFPVFVTIDELLQDPAKKSETSFACPPF